MIQLLLGCKASRLEFTNAHIQRDPLHFTSLWRSNLESRALNQTQTPISRFSSHANILFSTALPRPRVQDARLSHCPRAVHHTSAMVQDPNFWRRFSVAVHNNEVAQLAKGDGNGSKEIKHAYVVSLSSSAASPVTTPTSQCHLSPAFPPQAFTRPLSAPISSFKMEEREKTRQSGATSGTKSVYFDAEERPEMIALRSLPSFHQLAQSSHTPSVPSTPRSAQFSLDKSPGKRASRRASRFRFALSSHPPSLPPTPKSTHFPADTPQSKRTSRRFTKNLNPSRLSLGLSLSGRPKQSFRFWTTITADASHSDSWLESQNKKSRQRTYMCWVFWMMFLVVVVGAIVTVLILRGKGII